MPLAHTSQKPPSQAQQGYCGSVTLAAAALLHIKTYSMAFSKMFAVLVALLVSAVMISAQETAASRQLRLVPVPGETTP